jgi:predicted metal-dependent HD superfamily phosphohydrolase
MYIHDTKINSVLAELNKLTNCCDATYRLWKNLYTDDSRKYHNWKHIYYVLNKIDVIIDNEQCVAYEEIKFAALFHDFFYTPKANYDTIDVYNSSEMAYLVAEAGGYHASACNRIQNLVQSTLPDYTDMTIDQKILRDADLAILASTPEEYKNYKENIKAEFSSIPEKTFLEGRKNILENLVSKPIFSTGYGISTWEERARYNIFTEIKEL